MVARASRDALVHRTHVCLLRVAHSDVWSWARVSVQLFSRNAIRKTMTQICIDLRMQHAMAQICLDLRILRAMTQICLDLRMQDAVAQICLDLRMQNAMKQIWLDLRMAKC